MVEMMVVLRVVLTASMKVEKMVALMVDHLVSMVCLLVDKMAA
jgi:hypothetical protein